MKQKQINDFWSWFSSSAEALETNVEDAALLAQLNARVRNLDPQLSWEIGPGLSKPWQLVISPNLDRDLRKLATDVISHAPDLPNWEFHSARQPKEWDYQLELESGKGNELVHLDASNWTFVLLQYPDGVHELLLRGDGVLALTDDARWQAAAITLESILGEDYVMDKIDEFELVQQFEPRFAKQERPIQQLREAIERTRLQ